MAGVYHGALLLLGKRSGCRTLLVSKGAGFDFESDAESTEALLRPGRPPFCDV
jgi:hypothetical protein